MELTLLIIFVVLCAIFVTLILLYISIGRIYDILDVESKRSDIIYANYKETPLIEEQVTEKKTRKPRTDAQKRMASDKKKEWWAERKRRDAMRPHRTAQDILDDLMFHEKSS